MKLKLRLLIALVIAVLVLPLSTLAAPPSITLYVYGDVIIDGEMAPINTIITAEIEGSEVASSEVLANDGKYFIEIPDGSTNEGKTIVFKVDGVENDSNQLIVVSINTAPSINHDLVITAVAPVTSNPPAPGGGGVNTSPAIEPQVLGVKAYSYDSGRMVKLPDDSAVYHITGDDIRHLYVNAVTFWTWHSGTWADQNIETISREEFDIMIVGDNVIVQPDTKLIRFQNSERAYAVYDGGFIKYVSNNVGIEIYGDDWKDNIILIQNGFEIDYTRGDPL